LTFSSGTMPTFFCKAGRDSLGRIAAHQVTNVKKTPRQEKSASLRVHPRIHRVLKTIPERLETTNGVSLKSLAAISGLSPSRFMHVFTESVGVPLRPYILHLRLQGACAELLAGATVTSAACSAGFSDAAHLTRTFRRMVGITPTNFLLRKRSPSINGTIVSPTAICVSALPVLFLLVDGAMKLAKPDIVVKMTVGLG
jgi:AraC-like DNA-binding protein